MTEPAAPQRPPRIPRTAIIAVHGVGSPPRFDTARGIADLLTQFGSSSERCSYPSFTENLIKIPTSPLVLSKDQEQEARNTSPGRQSFAERVVSVRPESRDRTYFTESDQTAFTDLDVAFMRDQLAAYESDCLPYNTIEIVGTRHTGPVAHSGGDTRDVHIFEMHWADLSRVGDGILRVLGALYQLILHIAHLGRKNLDLAAAAAAKRPKAAGEPEAWSRVAKWHAWALRFFTVGVPVFSMLLVGCVILFLPDAIAPHRRLMLAVGIIEVSLLIVIGVRSYFKDRTKHATGKLVAWILTLAAAGVAAVVYSEAIGNSTGVILLNIATVSLVLLTYLVIINRYDGAAPGALPWGIVGLVVILGGMLVWGPRFMRAAGSEVGEGLRYVAFAGFQFSYVLLTVVWLLIWACAVATIISNWRLRRVLKRAEICPKETWTRATRSIWTAKVTLALSLFGLIITSLVGYESMNVLAWRMHKSESMAFNIYPSLPPETPLPLITKALTGTVTRCPVAVPYDSAACSKAFFDAIIAQSGTAGLPVALAFGVLSVLVISWFVILVAVTSVRVPKSESTFARNVGEWVTDGFWWVHAAGTLLVFGFAVALTYGLVDALYRGVTGNPSFFSLVGMQTTSQILGWLAIAFLASSATLAAVQARLAIVTTKARPALGILLDVDNYLRESPETGTPRAKIAERYGSLLEHVVSRRTREGERYFDRVLIVSHSQGTVISADFLRFLTVEQVAKPNLMDVDLRIITMGCPLRQLYSVHFPHLYDWIDRTDDYGDGTKADDDKAFAARDIAAPPLDPVPAGLASTLDELSPSPHWLRVRKWVNLFTAGDYVGRPLWQHDNTPNVWKFDPASKPIVGPGRRERCLGDGTHTRYWTSLDVAEEIDSLVVDWV